MKAVARRENEIRGGDSEENNVGKVIISAFEQSLVYRPQLAISITVRGLLAVWQIIAVCSEIVHRLNTELYDV
jgi:hypothetical protein